MRLLISLALVLATVAGFCQGMPFRERIRLLELTQTRLMHISDQPVPKVTYGNRMLEAVSVAQMTDFFMHLASRLNSEEKLRQLQDATAPLPLLVFEYRHELESLIYDWEAVQKDLSDMWRRHIHWGPNEDGEIAILLFGSWRDIELKLRSQDQIQKDKARLRMLPVQMSLYDQRLSYQKLVTENSAPH